MVAKQGDDAKAHVKALLEKQKVERSKRLVDAQQAAIRSGKERFDLAKLANFMDVRTRFTRSDSNELAVELEREYYLRFAELKTLREFATRRTALDALEAN